MNQVGPVAQLVEHSAYRIYLYIWHARVAGSVPAWTIFFVFFQRSKKMERIIRKMDGSNAAANGLRKQEGGKRTTRKVHKTPAVGSKAQVWHGSAKHTSGGLTRKDLMKHKGRIVSKKKHALGKKAFKNLVKAGYKPKKGTFKLFKA